MSRDFLVIDAFTDEPFRGNPAAVMVMEGFPADEVMQDIASEHNLSETAFLVRKGQGHFDLRWFTPGGEVPLCGHATLASGHALLHELGEGGEEVRFETASGTLRVFRRDGRYGLDLPANPMLEIPAPDGLADALREPFEKVYRAGSFMVAVLPSEEAVRRVRPNHAAIEALDADELGITAPGSGHDVVSRLFAPKLGIPEDPFTGSFHAVIVPYWAERLGRTTLSAFQASARGGEASCSLEGSRVVLFGNAVTTMRGQIVF
jgi:PhzF family phenazine biosynthesis protein